MEGGRIDGQVCNRARSTPHRRRPDGPVISVRLRRQISQFGLNMISPAIGVVSLPVLTRFYSADAYANYATLLTILTLASAVAFGRLEVRAPLAMRAGALDR